MKTQLLTAVVLLLVTLTSQAQNNVGIGTITPHPKSILELQATDKGLLVPRLSNAQMLAITTPPNGLLVYNTTQNCFNYYNTTTVAWKSMCSTTGITNSGDTVIINLLKADSIFANYLTVNSAFINNLFATTIKADTGYIKNIISQYITADSAYIKLLRTDSIFTNYLQAHYIVTDSIYGQLGKFDSLIIKGLSIDSLIKQITTNYLNTKDTIVLKYLQADSIYTTLLRADSAFINYLHANTIKADTIVGGVGNFTTLNVGGIPINQLITDSITAQAWLLKGNNASSANKLGTINARDLHIITNNTERISVMSGTGNVGIGQTLPAEKLDVIGNIKTTGSVEFGTTLKPAGLTGTTGDILISQGALLAPTWVSQSSIVPTTTNTLANPTNTITSTVNGVVATSPAVNTVANTLAGTNLTTTVNGVAGTPVNLSTIVPTTTNTLANPTNTITSTVNGVVATSPAVNTVSNALAGTNLTTTVNGVAGTPVDLSTIIPPSNNWSLLGNAGTVAGANFLGTTDNMDLVFKRNSIQIGNLQTNNSFLGWKAGVSNTTGILNTAIGEEALRDNSSANFNTAIGASALQINTGAANTALGFVALSQNTTGQRNIAIGFSALFGNTTASDNIGIGYSSLNNTLNTTANPNIAIGSKSLSGGDAISSNNTANDNVAIGYSTMEGTFGTPSIGTNNVAVGNYSLSKNTSGNFNTATGYQSLFNSTTGINNTATGSAAMAFNTAGTANTANGRSALLSNTLGNNNTAIGYLALQTNTTGNFNTAMGYLTLQTNTTGNLNTALGSSADVTLNNLTRATAIGYNAKVGASNAMVLGGTGVDAVNVGIGTATPHTSALLDMTSTTKGLLMPRVTTVQRLAINNNTADATIVGLQVYDTDTKTFWYHDGVFWVQASNNPDPTVGSVAIFPFLAIPADYLECNGAAVSRTTYAALFAKIGTTYGAGDGSTTFNLPELRGEFLRGLDNGRGVDAARVMGSAQADIFKSHTHFTGINTQNGASGSFFTTNHQPAAPTAVPTSATGGAETRPRNVAMIYAIKAIPTTVTYGSGTIATLASTIITDSLKANAWLLKGNAGTNPATNFVGTTDAQDFVTRTNNLERMRVLSNGNVGIGTKAPEAELHIATESALPERGIIIQQAINTSNSPFLILRKSNGTLALPTVVNNNDQLGTIFSEAYDGTSFLRTGSSVKFVVSALGAVSAGNVPSDITFNTGNSGLGTERMRILNNGNVGIGTVTPNAKLHLVGTPSITNGNQILTTAIYGTDITGATSYGGTSSQLTSVPLASVAVNQYLIASLGQLLGTGINRTYGMLAYKGNNGSTGNFGVVGVIEGQATATENQVAGGYFVNNNGAANQWALYTSGRTFSSTGVWTASDKNLKQNITPLTDALAQVNSLKLYSYYFNTEHKFAKDLGLVACPEKQYGVLAQELKEVFPDMVTKDGLGNNLVKYEALIPVALKAIQEQQQQIELLKKEIELLKRK